ncbi:hypothetical protein BH24DEI2_BH24DEI2_15980 [soil metagenome]
MKFVTWNINGGYGLNSENPQQLLGHENLDYFTRELELIDADVVCLQEVHVNSKRSQAYEVAESLGYPFVFESAASESHIDSNFQLANAILAKQAFQATHCLTLPQPHFPLNLPLLASGKHAIIHDKVLQVVQLNGLTVGNTHLLPLHILGAQWDSVEGRELAAYIAETIRVELQTPLVLCGDFNYSNVSELMPELMKSLILTDALPNEPSLPHSDTRIDYILISEGLEVHSSEIVRCYADHFPCAVVLKTPLAT